ncbi:MAG TPA: hypothetical protein VLJ42_06900 [Solirubrobacteraceae bacterium]|nr:hypothetical protein [Solirubrobacteraceae bacterium]
MSAAAFVLQLPVALGGDSGSGNGTAIAAVSIVSIVGGYLLLAGLWYFVFREKAQDKRRDKRAKKR